MTTHQLLALSLINGVGRRTLKKFIATGTSMNLQPAEIVDIFIGLNQIDKRVIIPTIDSIHKALLESEQILYRSEKEGIQTISFLDTDYPPLLKLIEDSPVLLHYKGNLDCLHQPSVAVVGTRNITDHAKTEGEMLTLKMCDMGFTIVSGLAIGCDTVAHRSAVNANRPTAAFMAGGLDTVYPKENKTLANQILDKNGVLIGEYEYGRNSDKNNFKERNRLQSGSSEGIIVLETGMKGGTRHTAWAAKKQDRLVGCLYTHFQINQQDCEQFQGNIDIVENEGGIALTDFDSMESFASDLTEKRENLLQLA